MFRTLLCCLLTSLFFLISAAAAEEVQPISEKEGKTSFSMSEPGAELKSVSKEKQKKIRTLLQDISRIVTATPVMSPPKGFEARFWGSIYAKDRYDSCSAKKCPPSRPTAILAVMLGRYEESGGKIKAAFNKPSAMDISINNLGHVFAHLPVFYKDAQGYLLPEPKLDGERSGMTTYLNNGHAVSLLANKERPLWQPVSRERFLKAAMDAALKDSGQGEATTAKGKKKQLLAEISVINRKPMMIEESRTWIDPAEEKKWVEQSRSLVYEMKEAPQVLKERIKSLQAELDSMTPDQRNMQARVDAATPADGQIPSLLPLDSSSGLAVVTPDFRYFDPKLPTEAIQLIVVQWKFNGNALFDPEKSAIDETLSNRKLLEIYRSMDWQKLRSNVIQTAP